MGILIPASTAVVIKSVPSVRKFCLIASMDTCDFGFMPLKSSRGIRAAVVGASPNSHLQIQYSIQIFVKFGFRFYLRIIHVFGFASRGFVPTSVEQGLHVEPRRAKNLRRPSDGPRTVTSISFRTYVTVQTPTLLGAGGGSDITTQTFFVQTGGILR